MALIQINTHTDIPFRIIADNVLYVRDTLPVYEDDVLRPAVLTYHNGTPRYAVPVTVEEQS